MQRASGRLVVINYLLDMSPTGSPGLKIPRHAGPDRSSESSGGGAAAAHRLVTPALVFLPTQRVKTRLLLVYFQLLVLIVSSATIADPARLLLRQRERQGDVKFLGKEFVDGAPVAQVHPVANSGVLFLVLALAVDNVVVALGA